MDFEPLSVPLVRQQSKSLDCLRCCASMVFAYFQDSITKDEIWRKLHVYKKHSGLYGSYSQDFGILAIKHDYQATIYHSDWGWWDKPTVAASKKSIPALVKALKTLIKNNYWKWPQKKVLKKQIRFIQAGGNYVFTPPSLPLIDNYLNKQIPVLLFLNSRDLYEDPSENSLHKVVIIGKQTNNYIIRDPYLALDTISGEQLLSAWTRGGGWMMVVTPLQEKSQMSLF